MDSQAGSGRSLHESLVELLPDAILVLDEQSGRFLLANAAAERLLGLPRQQLARLGMRDLVRPWDLGPLARVEAAIRQAGAWRGELWLRRPDDTFVPCEMAAQHLTVDGRSLVQLWLQDAGDRWRDRALQQVVGQAAERLAASFDLDDVRRAVVTTALPGLADAALLELAATENDAGVILAAFADPAAAGWPEAVVQEDPTPATQAMIRRGRALVAPLVAHGRQIGALTLRRAGGRTWEPRDHPLVEQLANHAAHALDQAQRWLSACGELDQQAAQTRILAALDADDADDRIHQVLLHEALGRLAAEDAGIARWDADRGVLVQALSPAGKWTGAVLDHERSLVGLAAAERRPLIENEYQRRIGSNTPAGRAGAKAVLAVPMLHRGVLLGSMSVSQLRSSRRFGVADARRLERLASTAALALSSVARQRVAGAQLAAQEAAHLLNNDLMLTMGPLELVRYSQELPPALEPLVETALDGMSTAANHLRQLQQLRRVVTTDGPLGPRLDLSRSTS